MNFKRRLFLLLLAAVIAGGLILLLAIWDTRREDEDGSYLTPSLQEDRLRMLKTSRNALSTVASNSSDCQPIAKVRSCEVIHVALVVGGYNTSRTVVPLLKSILFYRHNPLHFHFITDSAAHLVLDKLMSTWQLPAVEYSFYSTEDLQHHVSWIPNVHYSGVYGLMKLLLPSILPPSVEDVIVLDTDITVVRDVSDLWRYLHEMRKSGRRKLLGLVENQSNWYLGTIWESHRPWPALGRGFNTGVMLLRVAAMRENDWNSMWRNLTHELLKQYHLVTLADQDIINALIKTHLDIHYRLPCSWNVQLGEHTLSEDCYGDIEGYNIIHWNSPHKLFVANKHASYFRNMYYTFLQYNGNLLQRELLRCGKGRFDKNNSKLHGGAIPASTSCAEFKEEASIIHRIHIFYFGERYTYTDPNDITLVTQLSWDRIQILDSLLKQWEGPMSISVYTTDYEAWQLSQFIQGSTLLYRRPNVAIHLVYKEGQFYPINILRNTALKSVSTPYVYLTDVDFLPMLNLYTYLKGAVKVMQLGNAKRALVVPAFETLLYKLSFPKDKGTLLRQLQDGKLQVFRHSVWKKGHAATNYKKWLKANHPYKVKWMPDFEPYVVVPRNITLFDERFLGFGWNKVSHITELFAQGYEFVVLPEAFAIHMPHAPSLDIARYRTNRRYRMCLQQLKKEFIQDLVERYGSSALRHN